MERHPYYSLESRAPKVVFNEVDFLRKKNTAIKDYYHPISELDSSDFYPKYAEDMVLSNLARGTVSLINECLDNNEDTLFFLDKSARPAAFLFRETWRRLNLDRKLPGIYFINYGREKNPMNDMIVEDLRRKYRDLGNEGVHEELSPNKILVLDEIINSGGSLFGATLLIQRLFPKAKEWKSQVIYEQTPFWYDENSSGVRDSNDTTTAEKYIVKPVRKGDYHRGKALALREGLRGLAQVIAESCERN